MSQNTAGVHLIVKDISGDKTKEKIFRLCMRFARKVEEDSLPNQYKVYFPNINMRDKGLNILKSQTTLQIQDDGSKEIFDKINQFVKEFNQKSENNTFEMNNMLNALPNLPNSEGEFKARGSAASGARHVKNQTQTVADVPYQQATLHHKQQHCQAETVENKDSEIFHQQNKSNSSRNFKSIQNCRNSASSGSNHSKVQHRLQQHQHQDNTKPVDNRNNNLSAQQYKSNPFRNGQSVQNDQNSESSSSHHSKEQRHQQHKRYDKHHNHNQQQNRKQLPHSSGANTAKSKNQQTSGSCASTAEDDSNTSNQSLQLAECLEEMPELKEFNPEVTHAAESNRLAKGLCAHCNVACKIVCLRCLTFYCSKECQMADWMKHRLKCGSLFNKTSLAREVPLSNYNVQVLNILKSNLVAICDFANRNEIFENMNSAIDLAAEKARPLKDLPVIGSLVLVQHDGKYYRALVHKVESESKIFVYYQDYGNMQTHALTDMLEMPDAYKFMPRRAVPVVLKNVPDMIMNRAVAKYMHSLIGRTFRLRYKLPRDWNKTKNILQVVLVDVENNLKVNEEVVKLQQSNDEAPNQQDGSKLKSMPQLCSYDPLPVTLLPLGKNVSLMVLNNRLLSAGIVYCTTEEFMEELNEKQIKLKEHMLQDRSADYTPIHTDELCFVQCPDRLIWYRGRVVVLHANKTFEIQCIDFGYTFTVPSSFIRKFNTAFQYPVTTGECAIKDLPIDVDIKELHKLLPIFKVRQFIKCDLIEYNSELKIYVIVLASYLTQKGYFATSSN